MSVTIPVQVCAEAIDEINNDATSTNAKIEMLNGFNGIFIIKWY
jgi:hypothetical protein